MRRLAFLKEQGDNAKGRHCQSDVVVLTDGIEDENFKVRFFCPSRAVDEEDHMFASSICGVNPVERNVLIDIECGYCTPSLLLKRRDVVLELITN
jgi:hypothetical protein